MISEVTKWIEFDAGHRIPFHDSKCRHLHGHRYRVEATLRGPIQKGQQSQSGMVLDFGHIKAILTAEVHDKYDHRFLFWTNDAAMPFLNIDIEALGIVLINFIPTAENLAQDIFVRTAPLFNEKYGTDLHLVRIRVYETPTSFADCIGD